MRSAATSEGMSAPPFRLQHHPLAAYTAARIHKIWLAVARVRRGVHHHNVERAELMPNTLQFRLHIRRRGDIAVLKVPEIKLHAGVHAPLERHLVDGDRPLANIHRGVVMLGRVQMRTVVRGDAQTLHHRALAVRQIMLGQP